MSPSDVRDLPRRELLQVEEGQACIGNEESTEAPIPRAMETTDTEPGIEKEVDAELQQAQEAALKAGAFGGSRGTILESEIQKPYIQQAADTEAALRQAGYQQALQTAAQQQGFQAGLLGDLYSQQLQGLGLLSGIGGQQQQLQQAALDAARGEFERALAFPAQQLAYLTGAVSGVPTLASQYTKKKTGPGDILGALLGIYGE